jgi:hypothetical protein
LKTLGPSLAPNDFKDNQNFADFETPTFEPYEDEEFPASKIPDIDDMITLTHMTNVLTLKREF